MKKLLVLVMVAFATSAFALNPGNFKTVNKLNNESTFNAFVRYLNADNAQADQLKYLFELTENEMKSAMKTDNESAVDKVMSSNFGNARYILSDDQYRKYVVILNLSIKNYNRELFTEK